MAEIWVGFAVGILADDTRLTVVWLLAVAADKPENTEVGDVIGDVPLAVVLTAVEFVSTVAVTVVTTIVAAAVALKGDDIVGDVTSDFSVTLKDAFHA